MQSQLWTSVSPQILTLYAHSNTDCCVKLLRVRRERFTILPFMFSPQSFLVAIMMVINTLLLHVVLVVLAHLEVHCQGLTKIQKGFSCSSVVGEKAILRKLTSYYFNFTLSIFKPLKYKKGFHISQCFRGKIKLQPVQSTQENVLQLYSVVTQKVPTPAG